jgi:hypothetical protein
MKQAAGNRAGITIALIVAAALSVLYFMNIRFLEELGEKTLDVRFSLRGRIAPGFDFLTTSAFAVLKNPDSPFSPPEAKMVLSTLLRLSAFAKSLSQINMIPDSDGTLLWEMLAVKFQDDYFAPIGLQAARIYRGLENTDLVLDFAGSVHLGDTTIPNDKHGIPGMLFENGVTRRS